MAQTSFSASARVFKSSVDAAFPFSPTFSQCQNADPAVQCSSTIATGASAFTPTDLPMRGASVPSDVSPDVSPDEIVAIMAALDEHGGTREIGDLALAIPDCARPISAILGLVDVGRLWIDTASPFDAATRVTRID